MKVCSTCKLPKERYYKNKYKPDGLQSYCVDCSKVRSSKRYREFSEEKRREIKDLSFEKKLRNKQYVWDFLKEHPCVDCGETDPIVLEFDHLSGKEINVSRLAPMAVSIDRIQKEIDKCEVRCANCHRRKTAKQFGWYQYIDL